MDLGLGTKVFSCLGDDRPGSSGEPGSDMAASTGPGEDDESWTTGCPHSATVSPTGRVEGDRKLGVEGSGTACSGGTPVNTGDKLQPGRVVIDV